MDVEISEEMREIYTADFAEYDLNTEKNLPIGTAQTQNLVTIQPNIHLATEIPEDDIVWNHDVFDIHRDIFTDSRLRLNTGSHHSNGWQKDQDLHEKVD